VTPRPRVVYDCNVFLQAIIAPAGPSAACVRLVDDRRVILLLSPAIIAEVRGVLNRPVVQQRARNFPAAAVEPFISKLSYVA
jgi:predicted nucleic acid-binding protein